MNRITGAFEVKLSPQEPDQNASAAIGRLLIDKQFQGDLTATSKGQMLSAISSVQGSAGYVAIEEVTGTLKGRQGSFVLMHTGLMARGAPSLTITVVPDSGTGELVGLSGSMDIQNVEGQHLYSFEYALPE